MYCPVEMMSPILTFDIKGKHRKRAVFESTKFETECFIQQYHYISLRYAFVQCHKGT